MPHSVEDDLCNGASTVRPFARRLIVDGLGQAFERTVAADGVRFERERRGGRVGPAREFPLGILFQRFLGGDWPEKVRWRQVEANRRADSDGRDRTAACPPGRARAGPAV